MKKLFTLGAVLIALATAGPALADHGQSTDHAVVTVQLGSGNVSPAASANAPANVDAPRCVAGICSSEAGPQENGGASADTNGGSLSGSSQRTDQSADESIGTVQIGSASVDPAAAVSAPVNANAPVCILASCSSSSSGQQTGSTTVTTSDTGQSQPTGNQSTDQSIGTVQIGSASVDPAAAVSAPVNANAPVCVLSTCSSTTGGQSGGGGGPGDGNGGGDDDGGGGDTGGGTAGGQTGTGTTGEEPATPQTGQTRQTGQASPAGPPATSGNAASEPGTSSSLGGGTGSGAAGQGVGGERTTLTGTGRAPVQAAVTKGGLPFTGLPLPAALLVGMALLLLGATARKATASAEGDR
jgi:hypothetical protein